MIELVLAGLVGAGLGALAMALVQLRGAVEAGRPPSAPDEWLADLEMVLRDGGPISHEDTLLLVGTARTLKRANRNLWRAVVERRARERRADVAAVESR